VPALEGGNQSEPRTEVGERTCRPSAAGDRERRTALTPGPYPATVTSWEEVK